MLPSARVEWAVATRGTQECRLVRRGPDADGFECARAGAAGSVISATLGQISLIARVAAAAASTSDGQRAGGGTCEKIQKLHHFTSLFLISPYSLGGALNLSRSPREVSDMTDIYMF